MRRVAALLPALATSAGVPASIARAAVRLQAATPRTRAAVVPARPAAITTPLRDDDLAWIAPLMVIQGGDLRRSNGHMSAATAALQAHAAEEAGEARAARVSAGTPHAVDELRGYSPHAAAPLEARYDAVCSGYLTRRSGGPLTVAAFQVSDVAAAVEFYRRRDWEVLGDRYSGYVLRAPDGKLGGGLGALNVRNAAAEYTRRGIDEAALLLHCPALPDGHGLTLRLRGSPESEVQTGQAYAAASAADALQLPGALREAGLTSAQWEAVWGVITQAQTDEMLIAQPGVRECDAGSAGDAARRRANVAWDGRNRAAVDAATRVAAGGG